MPGFQTENGYSAAVRLRLQINGTLLRVAQVGSGFLILRDQAEAPPGTKANVIIEIDGNESIYPVVLTEGIFAGSDFVECADLAFCEVENTVG